jgi:hypothetical protein
VKIYTAIIMLVALLCATNAHSESLSSYKADGITYKLNTKKGNVVLASYDAYAKSLLSCAPLSTRYINPLNERLSSFKVKNGGKLGCIVEVNRNESWFYKCYLSLSVRESLSEELAQRITNKDVFGDFTEFEKEIYFNRDICAEASLK